MPLLAHDLAAKGLAVSPRTLRRRLHEAGYRWKRPRYVYVARAAHLPHMWTAPCSQGDALACDLIACAHMSGLFARSHMSAGQGGFRDARPKH